MDNFRVVINHKNETKMGWLCLFSTVVSAVAFYFLWEYFVMAGTQFILPLIVALELLISLFYILHGKRQEILDAEGIRVEYPFVSKTYSWSDVCKFDIKYHYGKQFAFTVKNQKTPYIYLACGKARKKMCFEYREDIEQCIRRFYGAPDVDKRIQGEQ